MFPTLTRQADFAAVYAGQKQVSKNFVLFYLPHAEFRYAVVASKKTIGNAVQRNRAKRLLRELLRAVAARKKPMGDLILVARAGILKNKFAAMQAELEQCLKNWLSV
ncbi:ribonuclease P [Candidatus Termititenax aidoneus]|uniref:Ribonuclease P protein component n=1 Tax=Termititenax aidoneus TaxID=2218524 RepID=A0A388TB35_TERA1|nr:ribonuclease P [Candidatus Termititenax aidoneus]